MQESVHYTGEGEADRKPVADDDLGIRNAKDHEKTSGKLFITTLHGDRIEQVPYRKKNAEHGLTDKRAAGTRCDLIVYRILFWSPAYLWVFPRTPGPATFPGKPLITKRTTSLVVSSVFPTLHESLQQVLIRQDGWSELREVQEQACRAVRSGSDVLILAPTAGGKSEAALIPVLDDLLKHGRPGISCLCLSPLKALINDQEERLRTFCTPLSLSLLKWHGDVARSERLWDPEEPPHFLMITPESLEVLLEDRALSSGLRQLRFVLLDELHAFMETERGVQVKALLSRLDRLGGRAIQRIGLSATVGNPDEVLYWLSDGRHGSEVVRVPSPLREKQFRFVMEPEEEDRVHALIGAVAGKKALVFVNSRSAAEELVQSCAGRIRNLHVHHSSLSPAGRRCAEEAIRSPDGGCIICTSTLELGIDIGDLDVVVQVGNPDSVSSFLQRMGRTGRRDNAAYAVWILKDPSEFLCSIAIIECAARGQVEDLLPPERPYHVLLQQLLLRLHSSPRMTRRDLLGFLSGVPAFAALEPGTIGRILDHLGQTGYLVQDGEIVMPGQEAEKIFARSNGKELYSVLPGGADVRVVTPDGEVVGMLDPRFVRSTGSGSIALGGRSWEVVGHDEVHSLVIVVPGGPGGSGVFWTRSGDTGGFSPLVCRGVQAICSRGGSVLPLDPHQKELLGAALSLFPAGIGPEGLYVTPALPGKHEPVTIISMNGRGFNGILARLLRHRLGRKVQVRFDDFRILADGSLPDTGHLVRVLEDLRHLDMADLGGILPPPPQDAWKFARALPDRLFRDMIVSDFYHAGVFLKTFRESGIGILPATEPAGRE